MISVSYPILGGNLAEVGAASRLLKEQLKRLGVQADVMRRVMIAAYEAEANVTIHAARGTLFARLSDGRIDMEIVDQGPGIPDVSLALTEGWSTAPEAARKLGFGAGMGLPNIRRSSDRFSLHTQVGKGTRVLSTILFRAEAASPVAASGCAPLVRAERCVACLSCVHACPTEAIRLCDARPSVLEHLCVGCASCVAACRHGVFSVVAQAPEATLPEGSVLVAPAGLLGGLERDPEEVLARLSRAGVGDLRVLEQWEAGIGEEAIRLASSDESLWPVIAPQCPAVTNLILASYPSLIPHLLASLSPVEAASRELATEQMVVVVGCPAQAALLEGDGASGRVLVRTPADVASLASGRSGSPEGAVPLRAPAGWDAGDAPLGVVRADGTRRVLKALAAAERGLLADVAVLDLRLCDGGCAGSPLYAVDPAVTRLRLARAGTNGREWGAATPGVVPRVEPYERRRGVRLDDDMGRAMQKLKAIDELGRTLPGRDCAVCGSPTCASLAEDIVLGRTTARCPFIGTGGRP